MPTVPTDTTQSVFPTGGGPAYVNTQANPAAFGAGIAQAGQGLARAIDQGGDVLANAADAFQGMQNETLAKNADIQLAKSLTDETFDPQNGYFTKLGKDAVDGYQQYQVNVQQAYQDARAALPNPAAQKMFDGVAVKRVESSLQSGASHAAQQNKLWQIGTSDARAKMDMNVAANYYNDDQRFGQAIGTVKDEAQQQGELQGWSQEMVAAKQQDYVSQAWSQRIMRFAQDDPVKAQDMYNQNQAQIGAAERPSLEHYLKSNVQPVLARNIVDSVMAGQPVVNGQQLPALHAAVRAAESADNQDAVGPDVPGQGTAKSAMQVMDATNLNPGFGVRPAADDSLVERARVGDDYLDAMIGRYGGNQTVALAAYNWGPGKVDSWISKNGDPTKGQAPLATFVNALPPSAQAYVAKINAKVPPTAGVPPTSTDIRSHLTDWEPQVSALATQLYPNDPTFRDAAVGNLSQQVNRVASAQEATQKGFRDTLVGAALGANPSGGQKPTTIAELLSTPALRSAWAGIAPTEQIGVMDLLEHNAKGIDPPMNDAAMATYYRLKGESTNNPTAFAQEDLSKQFGAMPHNLTLDLINLQASADGRQARDQQQATSLSRALSVSKPILMSAGVHIPTEKDTPDKAQDYNMFTGRLSQSLGQFYDQNKRGPNDKELRDMTNSLLVQGAQSNTAGMFPWSTDKASRAFQTDPSQFYVPVPPAEKPKAAQAFQSAFGHPPSDGELQAFYTQFRLANSKGH